MLSLAVAAASLMLDAPVRIRVNIVLRTFPFSTLTQFFAVGTNQLFRAARSLMLVPSRVVVFGMFPFARSPVIDALSVKALTHDAAAARFAPTGTARSEPPRKPGIGCPCVWLGMTNWAVRFL